ncbi:hypothetical protein [Catenuloplanes japonicus]|uniref:hypothetical protein n=1 Tax=Catenuloplanes japonicus TaxID=33876 RepID=UPI000526E9A3|nr:hypothetical protein [Catenuloplanes japonicus]
MNAKTIGGAVAVAVLTVVAWFGWLGWDTEKDVDAAGNITGPYHAWQVVGCGVTLLAILVAAILLRVNAAVTAVVLTLAFTIVWTWDAARHDDSGLFAVGALLVFVGLAASSAIAAAVTRSLARSRPA